MFELNDSNLNETSRIKVVSVGDGGSSSLNRLINTGFKDASFIAIDTNGPDLLKSIAPMRIQIGKKITLGQGAADNSEIGEIAAKESREDIVEALGQSDMVFVIAGLGGSTGSGAAPIVASYAKNDIGALTVAIVTVPFSFEGPQCKQQAEKSIVKLKECTDAVITIYNDYLLSEQEKDVNDSTPNFENVEQLIVQAIQGIVNLVVEAGLISLDFNDVKLILKNAGTAAIGVGVGKGQKAGMKAAEESVSFPLLDENIKNAKSIIVDVRGNEEKLNMYEVNEAIELIQKRTVGNCNIIWGVSVDNNLDDTIKVTVIASGFDNER